MQVERGELHLSTLVLLVVFTLCATGYLVPEHDEGPDGQLVRFAPGRTWVALVPVELGASITFADGTVGA